MNLHQTIAGHVAAWRAAGYPCEEFPAVAEILNHQKLPGEAGRMPQSRYLRDPQIEALETYWWLRLVKNTPHILDLYRASYSRNADLLKALQLDTDVVKETVMNDGMDAVWSKIAADPDFVGKHKLESVRETLSLDYPELHPRPDHGRGKNRAHRLPSSPPSLPWPWNTRPGRSCKMPWYSLPAKRSSARSARCLAAIPEVLPERGSTNSSPPP